MTSPYGLLRSPWNYNPSPLLTRFGNVFQIEAASLLGNFSHRVFKPHSGVVCDDWTLFFGLVKGNPLQTYLDAIEDGTHGTFHFTFGGVGGNVAMATVKSLMEDYGFSYSNIASLAVSAQAFFKKVLASNKDHRVNCSADPWQNYALTTTADPGQIGGPSCDFADTYYHNDTTLTDLVNYFFLSDVDQNDKAKTRLANLEFTERAKAMKLISNMFPYDGDLAGAGGGKDNIDRIGWQSTSAFLPCSSCDLHLVSCFAALDPLFWVAHGAVERTFQKAMLSGVTSDSDYTLIAFCSGQSADSTKPWLSGFYLINETINTATLTNSQLTNILDPNSDEYRDFINFVYDTGFS